MLAQFITIVPFKYIYTCIILLSFSCNYYLFILALRVDANGWVVIHTTYKELGGSPP
jgi:hypothetical protein